MTPLGLSGWPCASSVTYTREHEALYTTDGQREWTCSYMSDYKLQGKKNTNLQCQRVRIGYRTDQGKFFMISASASGGFYLNSSHLTIKNDIIGLSCESKGHLFWTREASHGFSFIWDSKSGVTGVTHSQTSDYWQNLVQFAAYSGQELPNRPGRDHVTHLRNFQFIFMWYVGMDSYKIALRVLQEINILQNKALNASHFHM